MHGSFSIFLFFLKRKLKDLHNKASLKHWKRERELVAKQRLHRSISKFAGMVFTISSTYIPHICPMGCVLIIQNVISKLAWP